MSDTANFARGASLDIGFDRNGFRADEILELNFPSTHRSTNKCPAVGECPRFVHATMHRAEHSKVSKTAPPPPRAPASLEPADME